MFRKKAKSYKNLYVDILEIGVENVSDGVSYKMLKEKLEKMKYVFDTKCLEQVVKDWFNNSFTQCEKDKEIVEEGSEDNFILKGEASITYLNYINTRNSKWYCLGAIIVALIAIVVSLLK